MHADHRAFWLATAAFAAGRGEAARAWLAPLAAAAGAGSLGAAIERRLAEPPPLASAALGAAGTAIVAHAVAALADELHHGEKPRPRLRSVTGALVALNVAAFVVETAAGGATDVTTLFRLGAMAPVAVWAGEWWRPFSATFLHFGLAHLAFNAVGLLLFGPFVESRLGRARYALVYVLAGTGSMWGLALLGRAGLVPNEAIVVGASGSVMGVIGAQAAWMRRSWLSDRSAAARRRARDLVAVVALQSLIDLSLSPLTLAAHLLGFVLGVALVSATVSAPRTR
ncbi:MAG: rhomboid family intramembrane serine protease [Deltaproteobacteria bacterium]|nr:rhomboid family intramembrane serine protease [Deltaproteobacteria bacterium]